MLNGQNWLKQARRLLRTAQTIQEAGDHAYACFTLQQAAEMALKSGLEEAEHDHVGHHLPTLLRELCEARKVDLSEDLMDAARRLTRLYIPTRYPDALGGGDPADSYGAADSDQALLDARAILQFIVPEEDDA